MGRTSPVSGSTVSREGVGFGADAALTHAPNGPPACVVEDPANKPLDPHSLPPDVGSAAVTISFLQVICKEYKH